MIHVTMNPAAAGVDVQGNRLAENDNERCKVCMGPAGDDQRRCERLALPRHRTHLVDGQYHLPENADEINAALDAEAQAGLSQVASTGEPEL